MAGDSFTPTKASWARRAVFIGSIVFHGAAAVGLLIYSVLHVEELAPPEVTLTFFNAPPPPPPPPPPAGGNTQKKQSTKPKIVAIKNPNSLKEPKPPKDEPKEEHGEPGGVAGGVVGGVAGGVVGGVVGAPPTAAPPPPAPAAPPKMVPSFVFNKDLLASPNPHLPEEFTRAHPKQTVTGTYKICVGTDGHLSEITVMSPILGADAAIISQLRSTWLYKPQPLPICSIRNIVFNIN